MGPGYTFLGTVLYVIMWGRDHLRKISHVCIILLAIEFHFSRNNKTQAGWGQTGPN
jgi:hypothetical protein